MLNVINGFYKASLDESDLMGTLSQAFLPQNTACSLSFALLRTTLKRITTSIHGNSEGRCNFLMCTLLPVAFWYFMADILFQMVIRPKL